MGSLLGEINIIEPTHNSKDIHVRDFIENLPHIAAGETDPNDPMHRSARLNTLNLKRIQCSKPGGSWRDWPEELRLSCHKKTSGKSFGSVYGRMKWDEPSPTMTTQCTGLGNGRFGHPTQDRAISIREAALLQTFPNTYAFFPEESEVSLTKASRYIGNAVPPKLGEIIAISIKEHIKTH